MKIAFVDTSVILRRILGEAGARPPLEKFDRLYASELMRVEALRSLDRLRIRDSWPPEEIAARVRLLTAVSALLHIVSLQPPILRRASEPFPSVVGTLDAIHIATALLTEQQLRKPLLFLTHDRRQGLAAEAAGLRAEGF